MAALVNGTELILTGTVGDDFWGLEDCFTQSDVILALAQIGDAKDIIVRLNSGGGLAWEGSAIHAALARHTGKVTVIVEGCAASAASVIAMSGDDVQMSVGSVMMIHDPSGFTVGTSADHQASIDMLDALANSLAGVYAAKTGKTAAECRADMRAEIWLTPEDAIAKGYADSLVSGNDNADPAATPEIIEPTPFAYAAYRHPPRQITALADRKRWPKALTRKTHATGIVAQTQEPIVAEEKKEPAAQTQPTAKTEPQPMQQTPSFSRSDAAEIVRLCNDGGVPTMAASLISEGVDLVEAKKRINSASQIRDMTALARKQNPAIPEAFAATAIASGQTVDQVRSALFDHLVAATDANPVTSHHRAGSGGANHGGDAKTAARAQSKANMVKQLKQRGMTPQEV